MCVSILDLGDYLNNMIIPIQFGIQYCDNDNELRIIIIILLLCLQSENVNRLCFFKTFTELILHFSLLSRTNCNFEIRIIIIIGKPKIMVLYYSNIMIIMTKVPIIRICRFCKRLCLYKHFFLIFHFSSESSWL